MRARDRVEAWLAKVPPSSSTMLADRLLVRALMRGDERAAADLRTLIPLVDDSWRPEPRLDTTAFIASWALVEIGETERAAELDTIIRRHSAAWRDEGESLPEPWRSTYGYWTKRAGFAHVLESGAAPTEPISALYHDLHTIFFAADYGLRPLRLEGAPPAVVAAAAYGLRPVLYFGPCRRNADLLAECALAELCLAPTRRELLSSFVERWLRLQENDGAFTPSPSAPLAARHHASTVAALVLWKLEARTAK